MPGSLYYTESLDIVRFTMDDGEYYELHTLASK